MKWVMRYWTNKSELAHHYASRKVDTFQIMNSLHVILASMVFPLWQTHSDNCFFFLNCQDLFDNFINASAFTIKIIIVRILMLLVHLLLTELVYESVGFIFNWRMTEKWTLSFEKLDTASKFWDDTIKKKEEA